MRDARPNPRLHLPRSALVRSPLSRKPLDAEGVQALELRPVKIPQQRRNTRHAKELFHRPPLFADLTFQDPLKLQVHFVGQEVRSLKLGLAQGSRKAQSSEPLAVVHSRGKKLPDRCHVTSPLRSIRDDNINRGLRALKERDDGRTTRHGLKAVAVGILNAGADEFRQRPSCRVVNDGSDWRGIYGAYHAQKIFNKASPPRLVSFPVLEGSDRMREFACMEVGHVFGLENISPACRKEFPVRSRRNESSHSNELAVARMSRLVKIGHVRRIRHNPRNIRASNPRLQRTRLRAPLSRKPLGASRKGRGGGRARSAARPPLAECFGARLAGVGGESSPADARPFRLNGFRPTQALAR